MVIFEWGKNTIERFIYFTFGRFRAVKCGIFAQEIGKFRSWGSVSTFKGSETADQQPQRV